MKKAIGLLLIFTLVGCKPMIDKVVDVVTSQILEPVSMKLSTAPDLGEFAVSRESTIITIEIKNNSSEAIRKLALSIAPKQNIIKFRDNPEGLSSAPGYEGTCGETVAPGEKCIYLISFTPRKAGTYSIPVVFNYENLIEPQSKSVTFTATAGEPAALSFTNDISNYDFGVVEQTQAITKIIDIEIQNVGGLKAREVQFTLENTITDGAYEILENKCPTTIGGSVKCTIRIGYTPHNNNYSDLPITYGAKLLMVYLKDPKDNTGKLNAYFTFLSSTIEAKFKENFPAISFEKIIVGNKQTKNIKINNTGFRPGIMKEINFFDYQNKKITTCTKASSGLILNCLKNQVNFPFIVEDTNNCLEREVLGVVGKAVGESCYFKITYWPSTTFQPGSQSTHYFNDSSISLLYDSQWKGAPNLVTKNQMFTITADFLAAGRLVLDKVEVENVPLDVDMYSSSNNTFEADLGRLALVSSAAYDTYVNITLKNVGESDVVFTKISEGSTLAKELSDLGFDLNEYYRQLKHNNCITLSPSTTCSISFNLSPISKNNTTLENALMYDNTSNLYKKYKKFLGTYDDGTSIQDDGSNAPDRSIEIRLIANLIKKGFLTIETPSYTFPRIVNGKSDIKNIFLKNVGTGDIYAVIKNSAQSLDTSGKSLEYPFKVLNLATPIAPATKDCYDIFYPTTAIASNMPLIPDSTKFLAAGESCVMAVENALPEVTRVTTYNNMYDRPYSGSFTNTQEFWERKRSTQASLPVSFKYYDGDANPDDVKSTPYGYLGTTKSIALGSSFSNPANVIVRDGQPLTSALFYRPAISYPSITSSYPVSATKAAYTEPARYFDAPLFFGASTATTKSSAAINHISPMALISDADANKEIVFHAGSFPLNQTTAFEFNFSNTGDSPATSATVSEDAAAVGYPIQSVSFNGSTIKPFAPISIPLSAKAPLRFNFTPTVAGLYKRCYTLTYNSGLDTRDIKVCAYAEGLAASPKLQVSYMDIVVADNSPNPPTETPSGSWTTLTTPMNSSAPSSFAFFEAIKGSIVYSKKKFRVTNIGNGIASNFSSSTLSLPTDITIFTTGLASPCNTAINLAPGAYCEYYIKYMPKAGTASPGLKTTQMLIDMGSNLNQYVTYSPTMNFNALDPATLSVILAGTNKESIVNWSDPTTINPYTISASTPLDLKNFSSALSPEHLLLSTNPTVRSFTNILISNSSTIKASFLNLRSVALNASEWNTIVVSSDVTIWANRACFYGDDENNGAIAAADKGFNSTSVNKCYLQVDFKGIKTYSSCNTSNKAYTMELGQGINASCNPYVYTLKYWSYKRSVISTNPINLHIKGFIEPNRMTAASTAITNVSAVNDGATTGTASFSWTPVGVNPAWGSVVKYRVFYDTNLSSLKASNVFKQNPAPLTYKDTIDASTTSITIPNLLAGNYYYFKVFAIQSYTYTGVTPNKTLTYTSSTNIPTLALPVPKTTEIYNHVSKILIDKFYKVSPGTRTAGINACKADFFSYKVSGTPKYIYKNLINTDVFEYIKGSPAYSANYPEGGVGSIPHWLSDNAYDMATTVSLYDASIINGFPNYDYTASFGTDASVSLSYQKSCTNSSSCGLLYKIIGGDGYDMYYEGVFYATTDSLTAFHRCYGVILCPWNAAKLITDATCVEP